MAIEPFTTEELVELDQTLDQLEAALARLISLTSRDRQRLFKMGDKTEAFVRQALVLLARNRKAFPASIPFDQAVAQLATIDQLRPRTKRVLQLAERLRDTELAMGAAAAKVARQGYTAIRKYGENQGLENLHQALSRRFRPRPGKGKANSENEAA